jgi:hypothetical protein
VDEILPHNKCQKFEIKIKNCSTNAFSNWGIIEHGVSCYSFFTIQMIYEKCSNHIVFVDDIILIFKKFESEDSKNDKNILFVSLNKRLEAKIF